MLGQYQAFSNLLRPGCSQSVAYYPIVPNTRVIGLMPFGGLLSLDELCVSAALRVGTDVFPANLNDRHVI